MKSLFLFSLLTIPCLAFAAPDSSPGRSPQILVTTSQGSFTLQLDSARAPLSVRNFVTYVQDGFYNGTIFHRVIDGFMAQGGGFDEKLEQKAVRDPVVNESGNGLSNARGTIAMARTGDPHSATAQFFVNLVDNARLDPSPSGWGYCAFGKVTEGMDVLDKIASLPTGGRGRFRSDVPETTVTIEKMEWLNAPGPWRK